MLGPAGHHKYFFCKRPSSTSGAFIIFIIILASFIAKPNRLARSGGESGKRERGGRRNEADVVEIRP